VRFLFLKSGHYKRLLCAVIIHIYIYIYMGLAILAFVWNPVSTYFFNGETNVRWTIYLYFHHKTTFYVSTLIQLGEYDFIPFFMIFQPYTHISQFVTRGKMSRKGILPDIGENAQTALIFFCFFPLVDSPDL